MARVLIVEDNEVILRSLAGALRRRGHDVEATSEGREGFRLAARGGFDIIVTDLNMPGWEGKDTIGALDALDDPSPILVITGFPSRAREILAFPAVRGVLVKPFELADFLKMFDGILGCAS